MPISPSLLTPRILATLTSLFANDTPISPATEEALLIGGLGGGGGGGSDLIQHVEEEGANQTVVVQVGMQYILKNNTFSVVGFNPEGRVIGKFSDRIYTLSVREELLIECRPERSSRLRKQTDFYRPS